MITSAALRSTADGIVKRDAWVVAECRKSANIPVADGAWRRILDG